MNAKDFPEPTQVFGNPDAPLLVQIQNPPEGLPVRITIDKQLAKIRYEDETEERVTIVIERV